MKALEHICESLLDSNFDINIEPVKYNFKSNNLNIKFGRFVNNYNDIVVSYSVYNQAMKQLNQIIDNLASFEPQTATIDNLIQGLRHTVKGYSSQISQKDHDIAVDYLNGIRPIVPAAEDIEKLLIKMRMPKNIEISFEHPDNDLWAIRIYQLKYVSGANWVDDNIDALKSGIEKIKNVDEVEYVKPRHSLLITIK